MGVEGINSRFIRWLLFQISSTASDIDDIEKGQVNEKGANSSLAEPRIRGWALLDFYTFPANSGLIDLLVECNYRGRTSGEEGWP